MKISWSHFQVYHNSKTRRDAIASIIYPAATKQMQSFSGAAYFFHTVLIYPTMLTGPPTYASAQPQAATERLCICKIDN